MGIISLTISKVGINYNNLFEAANHSLNRDIRALFSKDLLQICLLIFSKVFIQNLFHFLLKPER